MDYVALPAAIIYIILIVIGCIGNGILIYATFRNKKLRHAINFVIAIQAGADSLYLVSHLVIVSEIIQEAITITFYDCFRTMCLPSIAMNCSVIISLFLAIDRLLAVAFPFWYMRMNKLPYMIIIGVLTTTFSVPQAYLTLYSTDHNMMIRCTLTAVYRGTIKYIWRGVVFVANFLTLIIYGFIYRYVKAHQGETHKRKLLRSLFITAATYTPSRFMLILATTISDIARLDPHTSFLIMVYVRVMLSFSVSCNCFVHYANSMDYRAAFREHLGLKSRAMISHIQPVTEPINKRKKNKSITESDHKKGEDIMRI